MIKDVCGDIAVALAENSPKLMIFGGVAMMLVGGVWACVKTHKKYDEVKEETDKDVETIHKAREECAEENYSKKDYQRDLAGAYGRKAIGYVKLYAGPVVVTIVGAALIFGGQHILLARIAGLTAAYEALDHSFREFREHVDENFGEGTSEKIALGGKLEKPVNTENKKWNYNDDPNGLYVFPFDQDNPEWVDDRALLYDKLTMFQQAFTDKMVGRLKTGPNGVIDRPGYIWNAEILHDLCIDPAKEGKLEIVQNTGNTFDPVNPMGDNFVDLGLDNPLNRAFFFEPGTDPADKIFRRDPIDHNDLVWIVLNSDGLIGPKINPNSRFQLDLHTKKVATVDF